MGSAWYTAIVVIVADVVVVGAGANGLVCALILARAGMSVHVLEDRAAVGGGCRTELPFANAPGLRASIGAHRVGLVPRDLLRLLGVPLPLRPRDPCTFVPTTTAGTYLLAGPGHAGMREAVSSMVSLSEAKALAAMHEELDAILADLAPAWVAGALGVEETGDRFVRATYRDAFVRLCRGSIADYLARFGVESDLVRAAVAGEALGSTFGGMTTPGTGAALLVAHATKSAAGGGDAIAVGGMGAVLDALLEAARTAGVTITTGKNATNIVVEGNTAVGVLLRDGELVKATTVISSADPMRLRAMVGDALLTPDYVKRIEGFDRTGSVAKVNFALSALPRFTCLPEEKGQHGATIHLVSPSRLAASFAEAEGGKLPTAPPLELVLPTATDASLRDEEGRHHASILVPWAPYDLTGTTWAAEEDAFTKRVLDLVEGFAPGFGGLVVDTLTLSPKKLETTFGITRGHIHHVDDALVFGDRLPYTTPIGGLYACGAGCAPAGGVFGVAGHNAAKRVLADLELGLERTEVGRKTI